jgi:hypothetical protein
VEKGAPPFFRLFFLRGFCTRVLRTGLVSGRKPSYDTRPDVFSSFSDKIMAFAPFFLRAFTKKSLRATDETNARTFGSSLLDHRFSLPCPKSISYPTHLDATLLHPLNAITMSSKSQSKTSASSVNLPPDGASCWLCLEEGLDESGAPLVRDCSCRGNSGFAHLPCLVKYAEMKSKDLVEKRVCKLKDMIEEKFFEQCPNCKQAFQGDLRYDLTKAQLSFVEREFKDLQGWNLGALTRRIKALDGENEADRVEGEEICAKILSLVEDMKKKSDPSLDAIALASVYQVIGKFNFEIGTKCCLEKAKYYTEKARDAIITLGMCEVQVQLTTAAFESDIDKIEARLSGERPNTLDPKRFTSNEVSSLRARYDYSLRLNGENHAITINMGVVRLAAVLFGAYHTIEAVRLLKTLIATSRRVHGLDHKETKDAELLLQKMQVRFVFIAAEPRAYQALRYENDGKKCVIQDPINEPRVAEEERTFTVPSTYIRVAFGTPVVPHGLKKAAALNGKIGDIRDYYQSTDRYLVHLEDKGLKPVKVKHGNLRIVFDLPGRKNLD